MKNTREGSFREGGLWNILKQLKILLLLIVLVVFLLVQSPIFATADNSLDRVEDEITTKQNQISGLKDQERTLLSDLVALESQMQQNRLELDVLQKKLNTTQSHLKEIQASFQNKQTELKEKKGTLRNRLADIYTESRFIDLDFVFSCKDIATLLSRIDYLSLIAKQDAKLVQKVKLEKEYLEETEVRIQKETRDLIELESHCKTQQAELDTIIAEKQDLLNQVREQKLESEEGLQELQSKAIAVRTKMNELQPPSRGTARGSLRMLATGYCPCAKCCGKNSGTTATGLPAGKGVVAVDPKVISLGTKLYISEYGEAIAGDTGGSIIGNRIDLGFDSHSQALGWGKRWIVVDILE